MELIQFGATWWNLFIIASNLRKVEGAYFKCWMNNSCFVCSSCALLILGVSLAKMTKDHFHHRIKRNWKVIATYRFRGEKNLMESKNQKLQLSFSVWNFKKNLAEFWENRLNWLNMISVHKVHLFLSHLYICIDTFENKWCLHYVCIWETV